MAPAMKDRHRTLQAIRRHAPEIFVAIAVFIFFAPALWNGFVNWDDEQNFLNNYHYRGLGLSNVRWMLTTTHAGPYQPLSWLTLGLDYTLWRMHPAGYHLTNLLLHALNAVLLYHVIGVFLRRAGAPGDPAARAFACAAGALFFAIHPLRVESVAWITERRDVLSGAFYLLTVLAYLQERLRHALAFFALGLLSKASGMTLPVVLLILDVYPLRRPDLRRAAIEKIPFVLLAAAAAALAVFAQRQADTMQELSRHGLPSRIVQSAYALSFYAWKTLVPLNLSPLYVLRLPLDPLAPRYLLPALAAVAITVVLVLLRRRWPWALAAWASYAVLVSPVLGLVQTGPQLAADRYTYLPSLPFAVLAAAGLLRVAANRTVTAGFATVLLVFGVLTFQQTRVWDDGLPLWNHALSIDPANPIAHNNRGNMRRPKRDMAGARADYDEAIRLRPAYAEAYNNRGNLRQEQGDLAGALEDYAAAVRHDPGYVLTWHNRGNLYLTQGRWTNAIADYTQSLDLDPFDADTYLNRANARSNVGDMTGAIADLESALRTAPPGWRLRSQVHGALAELRAKQARP
jgi:protein O-mannosyl-transferase